MDSLSRCARIWIALLAAAGLTLSACDSGGDVSKEPEQDLALSAEDTTTAQSPTVATSLSEAERVEAYCNLAVTLDELEDEIDISNDFSPENAKRIADAWAEFIADADDVIPGALAGDYELSKTAVEAFAEALETNDYDYFQAFSAMDPEIVNNESIEAASDRMEAYEEQVCGIVPEEADGNEVVGGSDPDSGGTTAMSDADVELIAGLLETEIGRQLFIDGLMEDSNLSTEQATCFVDTADLTTLLSFSQGSPSENAALVDLFSTLSDCNIDIEDFNGQHREKSGV